MGSMQSNLPAYDELPSGRAWGVWGDDDTLGTLNLLTPERIARAAALVRKGLVFPVDLDLALPDPPLFGRPRPKHVVHRRERSAQDELHFNTQSSSQWDGFRHVSGRNGDLYNGLDHDTHGVHHWAARGIAGRAVLVDVARHRGIAPNERVPVTVEDIEATLTAQGVALEGGDILLLRTGWLAWYRRADPATRVALPESLTAPGLAGGSDMARFLWDNRVAAIGADNPAVEAWPPTSPEHFFHLDLLAELGIPLGELWDLDALAADCAGDGVHECFFTSAPLNLRNGVASPPNALCLK